MEPEQRATSFQPEQSDGATPLFEVPQAPTPQIERPQFDSESTRVEQEPLQSPAVQPAPTLPQPVAPPLPASDTAVPAAAPADDLPTLASDDDLIEKEWVDKAKQIITSTKDDPSRREKEVARLQADYLRKRYGKELGAADTV